MSAQHNLTAKGPDHIVSSYNSVEVDINSKFKIAKPFYFVTKFFLTGTEDGSLMTIRC